MKTDSFAYRVASLNNYLSVREMPDTECGFWFLFAVGMMLPSIVFLFLSFAIIAGIVTIPLDIGFRLFTDGSLVGFDKGMEGGVLHLCLLFSFWFWSIVIFGCLYYIVLELYHCLSKRSRVTNGPIKTFYRRFKNKYCRLMEYV